MSKLRKGLDKIKPAFAKGGRLYFLHSLFQAVEVFLYVPDKVTDRGAHIRDAVDMKRTMITVMFALVPALLFGIYNVGLQHFTAFGLEREVSSMIWYGLKKVLPLLVVSYVVGLAIEIIFAQVRHHPVNEGFFVTGMLIPMIVPPDIPLWMLAVATAFAVLIGKEAFGGTGMNIVNPALLARAFLFFAFPSYMSGDKVWVSGLAAGSGVVDGFSGATALTQVAAGSPITDGFGNALSDWSLFVGTTPGCIGETSVLAILLGAILLLCSGIGSFRIMLSTVVGAVLMSLCFNMIGANPAMSLPWYRHLLVGGFAFGTVFMATDPVTACQTNIGKYIYGFLIGSMAIIIRVLNPAYPEGMMLAILLMNVFAPLIDHIVIKVNIRNRLKRCSDNEQKQ